MELAKINHQTFSAQQIPDLGATILIPIAMFHHDRRLRVARREYTYKTKPHAA